MTGADATATGHSAAEDIVTWTDVCALTDLEGDRGVAALLGTEQVALFRLSDGPLFAVGNGDPVNHANVMARGLVGSREDRPVVFSPLHKEAYDLESGLCLDVPGVALPTYPVRVSAGRVLVGRPGRPGRGPGVG